MHSCLFIISKPQNRKLEDPAVLVKHLLFSSCFHPWTLQTREISIRTYFPTSVTWAHSQLSLSARRGHPHMIQEWVMEGIYICQIRNLNFFLPKKAQFIVTSRSIIFNQGFHIPKEKWGLVNLWSVVWMIVLKTHILEIMVMICTNEDDTDCGLKMMNIQLLLDTVRLGRWHISF